MPGTPILAGEVRDLIHCGDVYRSVFKIEPLAPGAGDFIGFMQKEWTAWKDSPSKYMVHGGRGESKKGTSLTGWGDDEKVVNGVYLHWKNQFPKVEKQFLQLVDDAETTSAHPAF